MEAGIADLVTGRAVDGRKGIDSLAAQAAKRRAELTLKIQLDNEAFSRIYGHKSHPFKIKSDQKVAVRVISQFGEETTKVLRLKQ